MPTIDILGVPHAYEITAKPSAPSAPVLVFIHGWLLSRNYWQPLLERLAPNYQCLIYDLRGFGDSRALRETHRQPLAYLGIGNSLISDVRCDRPRDSTSGNYTLASYARDLKLLLERLEIERAWLIGHSLGGSIALWGANLCPDSVEGVICLNSGGGIYIKEEFERFRLAGQQLVRKTPSWLASMPLIDLLFARIMVARPLAAYWGKQRAVDLIKADRTAALGALLESTTENEVHLLPLVVSRLQQPVYFLAGEKDRVMEPKYVRHLASFHQLFETQANNVIEIPDCGHLSMVEQPDLVGKKIVRILTKHCI